MATITGTNRSDKLAGSGKDSALLKGLGGDDIYTLRLFTKTIYHPFGDPSEQVFVRDRVMEAAKGGYDTVKLFNFFSTVGFTGITPIGSFSASELANVEHIVASETKRSGKLISWNITAGNDKNLIEAPGSADTLDGGGGNDTIKGGGGADRLLGGGGDDRLFAGDGDDTLVGGSGKDLLDGGAGSDTVSFASNRLAATLDLSTGANSEKDQLRSIENAIGSRRADKLTGSSGNNRLDGMDGNDTLSGGKGEDWLLGGKGNDVISGGAGADRLDSGGGIDKLTGGAGADQFEFTFAAKKVLVGLGYLYYQRLTGFDDTITDFQDGSDKIAIGGDVFKASDLQHSLRGGGIDPFSRIFWSQVGDDTRIDFGKPSNSDMESRPNQIHYGSVTLENFDAAKLSAADFLFV